MLESGPKNLLEAIHARGLTVRQFADRLAVTASAVYRWSGKVSHPNPQRLEAIGKALGIAQDELARLLPPFKRTGRPKKAQVSQ